MIQSGICPVVAPVVADVVAPVLVHVLGPFDPAGSIDYLLVVDFAVPAATAAKAMGLSSFVVSLVAVAGAVVADVLIDLLGFLVPLVVLEYVRVHLAAL